MLLFKKYIYMLFQHLFYKHVVSDKIQKGGYGEIQRHIYKSVYVYGGASFSLLFPFGDARWR